MYDLIKKPAPQQELTTNLIRPALTEEEAGRPFGGLEASGDFAISNFDWNSGAIQRRAQIYNLISQLNSSQKHLRLSAAEQPLRDYASNPMAIEWAIKHWKCPG